MHRYYYEAAPLKVIFLFQKTITHLMKVLLILFCILLTACTKNIWIIKPLNVALPNQTAMANFVVEEHGGYRFALVFVWSSDVSKRERQRSIFGSINKEGVPIPIHFRLVKDGEVLFEEIIVTRGTQSYQGTNYKGEIKSTAIRDIKHFGLLPGNYFAEIKTLESSEEFKGIETYAEFSYYNPKI